MYFYAERFRRGQLIYHGASVFLQIHHNFNHIRMLFRLGGRIDTRGFGAGEKSVVEMGANFLEGTALTNSAVVLANESGLLHTTSANLVKE